MFFDQPVLNLSKKNVIQILDNTTGFLGLLTHTYQFLDLNDSEPERYTLFLLYIR
jgi:hypothetical protein